MATEAITKEETIDLWSTRTCQETVFGTRSQRSQRERSAMSHLPARPVSQRSQRGKGPKDLKMERSFADSICAPIPLPALRTSTSRQSGDVCVTAGPSKERTQRDSDYLSDGDDDCVDGWLGMMTTSNKLVALKPVQQQQQGTDHPS